MSNTLPNGATITAEQPDADSVAYSTLTLRIANNDVRYVEYSQHGEVEHLRGAHATVGDMLAAGYDDLLYGDWSDASDEELADYVQPEELIYWVRDSLYRACEDMDDNIEDDAARANATEMREKYADAVGFLEVSPRGFGNEILCCAIEHGAMDVAQDIASNYNNKSNSRAEIHSNDDEFWDYVETCAVDGKDATTSNPASGITSIDGWVREGGLDREW